jgi:hypothetical protein
VHRSYVLLVCRKFWFYNGIVRGALRGALRGKQEVFDLITSNLIKSHHIFIKINAVQDDGAGSYLGAEVVDALADGEWGAEGAVCRRISRPCLRGDWSD